MNLFRHRTIPLAPRFIHRLDERGAEYTASLEQRMKTGNHAGR